MYSQKDQTSGVRREERWVRDEILSNTSSGDVSETEEHVTVHAKREPLPWSLRDPSYDKPLPGIISVSPAPSIHSLEPKVSREARREGVSPMSTGRSEGPGDLTTLRSKSPMFEGKQNSPLAGDEADFVAIPIGDYSETGTDHDSAHSPSGSLIKLQAPDAGPPGTFFVEKASGCSGERANAELNHSPPTLFSAKSPIIASPPDSIVRRPSPRAVTSAAGIIGVPTRTPSASPVYSASPNDADVSFEEDTPPLAGRPLSGFDEEANAETLPFVAVPVPRQANGLVDEGLTGSPRGLKASPLAVASDESSNLYIPPPVVITILSPASPAHVRTPIASPKEPFRSPPPGFPENFFQDDAYEASSKAETEELPGYSLGDKRARSPYSMDYSSLESGTGVGGTTSQKVDERLWAKYRKDWKVNRKRPVDQFFFPRIFNPARLQYLHIPRKQHSVPRAFQRLVEDAQDPGARYRRDWKVERHFPITRYFNPQLFDEGHLRRVKIPSARPEKKRAFKEKMGALGIVDMNSPAARLRRDWQAHRPKPVEYYYEPSLFESNVPLSQKLREDWYSLRPRAVDTFNNPILLSEAYCRRKARNVHYMLARLRSSMPWKFRQRIRPIYHDLGEKYRQDWQVHRANDLLEFWDPMLFDLKTAQSTSQYWHDVIARYNQRHHPCQELPPNLSPASGLGHAFTEPLGYYSPRDLSPRPSSRKADDDDYSQYPEAFLASYEKLDRVASVKPQEEDNDCKAAILATIRGFTGKDDYTPDGSFYDWPFWESCLQGDTLDAQQRADLLTHLQSPTYAGIPDLVRPTLWRLLSGAYSAPELYGEYELLRGMPCAWENSISNGVVEIQRDWELSEDEIIELHLILSAYANLDQENGLSPMLIPLAATLLRATGDDSDAFVILTCIMRNFNHRRHLQPAVGGCEVLFFQLDRMLIDLDPQLAIHLGHHDIDISSFAQGWYASLCFTGDQQFSEQVLDLFLLEGYAGLHQVALALLVENRDELLQAGDFASLMSILEGDLLGVHVDWSLTDWRFVISQVIVLREDLSELEEEYRLTQEAAHSIDCIQKLAALEQEHDSLLGSLGSILTNVKEVCLAREQLTAELLEARHDQRALLERAYQQAQLMAETHRETNELHLTHLKKERRLSVKIQESTIPTTLTPRAVDGAKVYRI